MCSLPLFQKFTMWTAMCCVAATFQNVRRNPPLLLRSSADYSKFISATTMSVPSVSLKITVLSTPGRFRLFS